MQLQNIEFIVKTFEVLKLDKFNEVNLVHPLNILFILVTFEESKLDKSIELKFLLA